MSTRGGLGRGLGSLIPAGASSLEEISCDLIIPNRRQPRRSFEEGPLAQLASSIKSLGLLQPVVVRRRAEGFELVMGERRWRAAKRAGLQTIPALVVDTDDRGALERALVENVQRQDLNAIEEAAAFRQLIEDAGLTHEQLAERVGVSRPSITNSLRLLELPELVQKLVIDARLSAGHARALMALGDHPLLERIAQRVAAEGLSVRETEELVRKEKDAAPDRPASSTTAARTNPGLIEISERLSDELSTRVTVTMGRGKGRIVIEFGSVDDLERLVRKLVLGTT